MKGILEQMADSSEVEEVGKFIQLASEYVWQGKTKATSFLALQAYKDVIASKMGQRYFTYCDELWKI